MYLKSNYPPPFRQKDLKSGLLDFWTLSIIPYSKEHNFSETGSVSVLRKHPVSETSCLQYYLDYGRWTTLNKTVISSVMILSRVVGVSTSHNSVGFSQVYLYLLRLPVLSSSCGLAVPNRQLLRRNCLAGQYDTAV
jgi:hypothetical protein